MKKILYIFSFIAILFGVLFLAYFFTQDLPVYDRFYSPQERNARDIKRIARSLPDKIGEYVLQPSLKYPDLIQAYEGCYDKNGQGTEEYEAAVWCEREIFAHYRNPSTDREMTVDFLSTTKGLDDYKFRNNLSFNETTVGEWKVFRFKAETDNEILWYPEENRNPILKSLGWYPEKTFTSIAVQQSKVVALVDGGESKNFTGTIDTMDGVVSYFLEKYPPGK